MKNIRSMSLLLAFFLLGLTIVLISSHYFTLQVNAQQLRKWDFAARVMPDGLSQQVKKETLASDWIGDPRRFKAIKYVKGDSEFYLVWTNTDCPEKGCLEFYHRPTCGAGGQCQFVGYAKRGDRFEQVFETYLLQQMPFDRGFSKVTESWIDGVPECFTLTGVDTFKSPKQIDKMGIVTYCFNQTEKQFKYRKTQFENFPADLYSGIHLGEIQTKPCLAWFIARDSVPHATAHRYKEVEVTLYQSRELGGNLNEST